MAFSELLLQSGSDIPFVEAKIAIHQPKIKEISYLTEEKFYSGTTLLNFSKNKLMLDKAVLNNISDFKVFMSMVNDKDFIGTPEYDNMKLVLELIFPLYHINFSLIGILLVDENNEIHAINEDNFDEFKKILTTMFMLNSSSAETQDYNPGGPMARKLAEKMKKSRAKKQALQGKEGLQKISILSRYMSILAVGLQKDKNDLLNYTIPQLFDEFNRFQLKVENDIYIQAKMMGAKDLKEVDSWMKDMYES